jgi:4-amino-4-deoxy-L-arabinose transferase-like glycosyltransferase
VLPALLAGAMVVVAGLMAREMGGRTTAQSLAALAMLTSPVHMSMAMYFSMNPIDQMLWAVAAFVLLRIVNGGDSRLWLALGVIVGAGLANKVSVTWFCSGVAVGLLLTPERRWLRTPWPWAAAAIAALCFVPFLWWQQEHGWPFLEFTRNAAQYKVGWVSPLEFLRGQIEAANAPAAPLWIGGIGYGLISREMQRYRPVIWIFVTVFLILALSGSARPHYLAPAFAIAFAAGGVAVEHAGRRWRWAPPAIGLGMIIGGIVAAPLAMPLLSPEATVVYLGALGVRPREELQRSGVLPMHLGLFFHAEAVLKPVTEVYRSLPPEDQARVTIMTTAFGETGAINVLGRKRGLPASVGRHNQYWQWGPGDATGEIMIVTHDSEETLRQWFETCERKAPIDCPYCMEMMQRESVYVCRHPRRPLRELWPEMKIFG